MALKYAYGNVRSVKISFQQRTGTIRLRTPTGTLTLKITNDPDGTFDAQTDVVSTAAEYGNVSSPDHFPHLHVEYEDSTMEISTVEFHWEHLFISAPGGFP